ncbi:MAG: peptidase MA family metallohydrolase [Dehalococcoidales bacterium]|nr:peptidase MA family metallohydrolase [Dehalococcoidales bacterium]
MTRRAVVTVLPVLFLVVSLLCGVTEASEPISVLESSVVVDFPGSITFKITAGAGSSITDIRLHYTVNRMSHVRVVSEVPLVFSPSSRVEARWVWDMRMSGGLPPGSAVDYWWTVRDGNGNMMETLPERVLVEDRRYRWRNLSEGGVTIYWYNGSDGFARELMTAVNSALARLAESTGAVLERPVYLYIYASSSDLRGAMIFPQEWTGGVAFSGFDTIAIGISPDGAGMDWGKRAIAHELTHLVVHQITFNPYNSLPVWLDEGLAMFTEGELEPAFVEILNRAVREDRLISVRSLASPFSAFTEQSLLSYAESYEIVDYLIRSFGQEKMLSLLNVFREGCGYDEALGRIYGFDMDGLHARWVSALEPAVTD